MICHGHGILALIHKPRLVVWLTEVFWHACLNSFAIIKDLLDSTRFFYFSLAHVLAEHLVSAPPRLDLLRHGPDADLVMLQQGSSVGSRKKIEGRSI